MIATPGILGPNGRPVSAERVKMEKQTRFNPLRGWTPDVLVRQLEAYARGEIAALAWVMEWLETHDDIIQVVAPKAKAAVSRHGYDVPLKEEIAPALKGMAQDQQGVMQKFFQTLEASDAVELEEQQEQQHWFLNKLVGNTLRCMLSSTTSTAKQDRLKHYQ